jgi:hypothetical protein
MNNLHKSLFTEKKELYRINKPFLKLNNLLMTIAKK